MGWSSIDAKEGEDYIGGMSACQTWMDVRRSNRYFIEMNWVYGYVEALLVNDKRLMTHRNDIPPAYVSQWFDQFCQKNPSKSLREAARDFHESQVERFKPKNSGAQ